MNKRLVLAALFPTLAGCFQPMQVAGSDRAIVLYHERLEPQGALSIHREERTRAVAGRVAPRTLRVEEAIALAKENSAELSLRKARVAAAEAAVAAADQRKNPELRISQLRLDQLLAGEPQVRTALRVSPERPGQIDARVAEARAEQVEAQAKARTEEMAIEAEVRWLFDDIALLDAEIAALAAVAEARQALATQMKGRLEASEATSIDEAMTELSASMAEADSASLRAERSKVLGELLDRLGFAPDASVQILGEPPLSWPPPGLPSEQILVEAALRRRPELESVASRIHAADARAFAERGKRWPWFSFVELGYEFSRDTTAGLGWTFQAGVEVPIFNTHRAGVVAADAAKSTAERALAAEVEHVAREVRARMREVEAAVALVSEFRSHALPAVERAQSATSRALEGHQVDAIRAFTLDERRVLVEVRLLRLVRRYRSAFADLRRTVGGALPKSPQAGERSSGSVSSARMP